MSESGASGELNRPRILVIAPGFPHSEEGWFIPGVSCTIRGLAEFADLHVISLFHPSEKRRYEWHAISVETCGIRLGGGRGARWRAVGAAARRAVAAHRRTPFDAVLALWATEAGAAALMASRLMKRRLAVFVAGGELVRRPDLPYGDSRHRLRRNVIDRVVRGADAVLVGSEIQASLALCGTNADPKRIHLAPVGLHTERFRRFEFGKRNSSEAQLIVSIADLLPVKGLDQLVEAVALLDRRDVRVRFVGEGPERPSLERLAEERGVADRIEFSGTVHHKEIPAVLRGATAFVQTSHWESQGVALLEAMSADLPVVSTPVGVAPELLADEELFGLVPHGEMDALAGQLDRLFDAPEPARERAARLGMKVREAFSVRPCAERFFEKVIG